MEEKNIIIFCSIVVLMEIKFNVRIISSDKQIDTIVHITCIIILIGINASLNRVATIAAISNIMQAKLI